MIKEKVLKTNLNEYYRCGERTWLETEDKKCHGLIHDADAAFEEKINDALWKDDVLRVTDNHEIGIHVKNGIVYMSGHLLSTTNRQRVEKALKTVDGIQGIKSNLVMDDELMSEVATSLGQLERVHHCKFFTGVSHGVVVLNGEVSSVKLRLLAEQYAASHPKVRAVINYIRVSGIDLGLQDHRMLQPPIGKEIYFQDGVSGIVRKVVANPDNRRVIAMIIQGHIYDSRQNLTLSNNSSAQSAEQQLVIPMNVVEHLTNSSGFLTIKSTDFTKYQRFDVSLFTDPAEGWIPPYPYCPEDVLFPINHQYVEEKIQNKELLANDSLGG